MNLDRPPANLAMFPHRCDVTRSRSDGIGDDGARREATVTVARSLPCLISEPTAQTVAVLAQGGVRIEAAVFFPADPHIKAGDRIAEVHPDTGTATGRGFAVDRCVRAGITRLARWRAECKTRV